MGPRAARQPVFAEPWLLARRLTLLPDPYLFGFFRFVKHSEARPSFLMGERSRWATGTTSR